MRCLPYFKRIELEGKPWSKNISEALGFTKPMFQIAATAEDPLWPYNAPGASSALDCVSALAAGANDDGTVKLCSEVRHNERVWSFD